MTFSSFGTHNDIINRAIIVHEAHCGLVKHVLTETYGYEMTSIIRMIDDDNDDKRGGEELDKA
jgi:hypothetical protein